MHSVLQGTGAGTTALLPFENGQVDIWIVHQTYKPHHRSQRVSGQPGQGSGAGKCCASHGPVSDQVHTAE